MNDGSCIQHALSACPWPWRGGAAWGRHSLWAVLVACLLPLRAQAIYVSISSPQAGKTAVASNGVWVSGYAGGYGSSGQSEAISNVYIYANSNLLGAVSSLQSNQWFYQWTYYWEAPPLGTATLWAVAWGLTNNVATSSVVTVTVTAANMAPIVSNISGSVVEGGGNLTLWPNCTDTDAGQSLAAIVVTPPSSGAVIVTNTGSGVGNKDVTGGPGNDSRAYFIYVPAEGFVGLDTFTYKMNDGFDDSNMATASVTVASNTPPVAYDLRATIAPNTNVAIAADYYDPDPGQIRTLSVVTPPAHGQAVTSSATAFLYAPDAGWTGEDAFTYRVSDGKHDSNVARCRLLVRDPAQRDGNLVVLAVNALLLPNLSNEVYRLKTDLENEGYTARITNWPSSGTSASNLWAYLRTEYNRTNQWLAGAILIGNLPKPRVTSGSSTFYTDLVYWNMKGFQTNDAVVSRHIWVSRMNVDNTTYGSEVVLLKRALAANHDYRTGASRLPYTAYGYINREWSNTWDYGNGPTNMLQTWPEVQARQNAGFLTRSDINKAGADAFVAGGEVFDETSHGSSDGYMSAAAWFTTADLFRLVAQVRAAFITSCSSGYFGGIANNQIYTRGGGNVISAAATETTYVGCYTIMESYDAPFRLRLAAGDSWGGALLTCFPISDLYRTVFYGDLSLRAMAAPSNAMPAIVALDASCIRGSAPLTVSFSVKASDPDGTLTNFEWFCAGYNGGRTNPTHSGNATNVNWTYAATGTVAVRVEAVDAYKARAWKEITVIVDDCSPKAEAGEDQGVEVCESVALDGRASSDPQNDPLSYAWTQVANGAPLVTLSNAAQAVASFVATQTNTYRFRLAVSDGTHSSSDEVIIEVLPSDQTPPSVLSVSACGASNEVTVLFSEALEQGGGPGGAENAANYAISLGVAVTQISLRADGLGVTLGTTPLAGGLDYVLTISNVRDRAFAQNAIASGTQIAFRCPDLPTADEDGNGIPDAWEAWYFGGSNHVVGLDADGDGLSDVDEFRCGTDPTNAYSCLVVSNLVTDAAGAVLSWPSVAGRSYTIRKAADLVVGFTSVVASNLPAQPPMNVYTDAVDPGPAVFYRVTTESSE
jgi:hypothetical protein